MPYAFNDIKNIFHPNFTFLLLIAHPHVILTPKTSVHLQNTNLDIFAEFWELSDPPININVITTIKVQKHSKDISKIIHISGSTVLLRRYEITLYAKKTKITFNN